MEKMKSGFLVFFLMVLVVFESSAQNSDKNYVLTTAVPFLMIAPEARGGGMGYLGVSSSSDPYSIYWNPAKYAFSEKDFGVGIGYVPWLRSLVSDMGLASVAGFKKFGDKQAIGASLRFFSLGEVQYTDINGVELNTGKPNEWAIDATYARKFSSSLSMAVAGRFIYSNLVPGYSNNYGLKPGTAVAADIAIYYEKPLEISGLSGASFNFGVNISNIGNKISYSSSTITRDFIPTNLRIGPSFTMDIDDYSRLSFYLDLNKLLVPSPPIYKTKDSANTVIYLYGADGKRLIDKGKSPDVSTVQGMIQSFYDSPAGFSGELREINAVLGAEYWYNKLFAIRAGYFYEDKLYGDRKFFTLGAGLRYNVFGLDFSYLIPVKSQNPLKNTLQFTLLFNFDQVQNKEKATRE